MSPDSEHRVPISEVKPTLAVLEIVVPLASVFAAIFVSEHANPVSQAMHPISFVLRAVCKHKLALPVSSAVLVSSSGIDVASNSWITALALASHDRVGLGCFVGSTRISVSWVVNRRHSWGIHRDFKTLHELTVALRRIGDELEVLRLPAKLLVAMLRELNIVIAERGDRCHIYLGMLRRSSGLCHVVNKAFSGNRLHGGIHLRLNTSRRHLLSVGERIVLVLVLTKDRLIAISIFATHRYVL